MGTVKFAELIDFDKGIMNEGNMQPIMHVFKRAMDGEKIVVGFIGGSITQGSLSSTPETCYAYLVYSWFKKTFPKADIEYVNAGIGGTTSQFGVARVKQDLLSHNPDFVLAEFSVNDDNTEHFKETYEGLIRTILRHSPKMALMVAHNAFYDTGVSAEDMHLAVAKAYNIPAVSMKNTVVAHIANGDINAPDITPDNLHPNDDGHALLATLITNYLEHVLSALKDRQLGAETNATDLPAPITPDTYENSIRYQNRINGGHLTSVLLEGFEADGRLQERVSDPFHYGYTAWKKGSKITFEITATNIAAQFKKTIHKPSPIAKITIDGDESTSKILDSNFDEDWGDCIYIETIAEGLEKKPHMVTVEIIEDHADDQVPFYLVSIIGADRE